MGAFSENVPSEPGWHWRGDMLILVGSGRLIYAAFTPAGTTAPMWKVHPGHVEPRLTPADMRAAADMIEARDGVETAYDMDRDGIDRAAQVIQAVWGKNGVTTPPSLGSKMKARQIVSAYLKAKAPVAEPCGARPATGVQANHVGPATGSQLTSQNTPNHAETARSLSPEEER